jgi:hypothetical protein
MSQLKSHEGSQHVKKALIDFLATWNDSEWVDWEKIGLVFCDLHHTGFWKMVAYDTFLNEAESRVSHEIIKILRAHPL